MESGCARSDGEGWVVYPAIDLRGGRVVRLAQGDPDAETEYADDPARVARRWRDAGASWVHVVNLDGAFGEGGRENLAALGPIVAAGLAVQFGGGLRDLGAMRQVLEAGAARLVVGTAAVQDPALLEAALEAFGPERVALAIDSRRGRVRTHGWQREALLTPAELGRTWVERGIRWIIFTDVDRDGMGSGLNLEATTALARETGAHVIASGGVATLDDVRRSRCAGLSGVIIGRALYEGHIALRDALRVGEGDDVG